MTEKTVFCTAPWHSITFDPDGSEDICCDIRGKPDRLTIQQSFLSAQLPNNCDICWQNEKNKLSSSRIRFNQRLLDQSIDYSQSITDIKEIHLDLGNLCNSKCLTCSPTFSTQIYKKWKDIGWIDNPPRYLTKINSKIHQDEYLSDDFFSKYQTLLSNSDNLVRIRFVGGEPLINPRLHQYIDAIPDNLIDQISILICTNATIYDPELIKKLKKFKQVEFTLSIDAYGELNDKIRVGSKWSEVEENFKKYLNLTDDKFKVIVNCTLSLYNILDLDRFLQWIGEYKSAFLNINPVYDPIFLSPFNLPPDWKILVKRRLSAFNSVTDIKTQLTIRGLLDSIDQHTFNEAVWQDFKQYTRSLS